MTAGPMERAFKFLNITSVNAGAPEEGAGVTEAEMAGVVLVGEAAAGELRFPWEAGGGSSWAKQIEAMKRPENKVRRVLIM